MTRGDSFFSESPVAMATDAQERKAVRCRARVRIAEVIVSPLAAAAAAAAAAPALIAAMGECACVADESARPIAQREKINKKSTRSRNNHPRSDSAANVRQSSARKRHRRRRSAFTNRTAHRLPPPHRMERIGRRLFVRILPQKTSAHTHTHTHTHAHTHALGSLLSSNRVEFAF